MRLALTVGDGVTLPDGKGTIQLDGWVRWVKLQVGDTPGVTISLAAHRLRRDRAVPVAVRPAAPGLGPGAQRPRMAVGWSRSAAWTAPMPGPG